VSVRDCAEMMVANRKISKQMCNHCRFETTKTNGHPQLVAIYFKDYQMVISRSCCGKIAVLGLLLTETDRFTST